jgi:hypothetical protein
MPAEAPVCARSGLVPKALDKPTAAAVAMARARNAGFRGAGFDGGILLGVLATIIWDKHQSRRQGTKPLAKLWLQPLTVNLGAVNLSPVDLTPVKSKASQLAAGAFAKRSRAPEKPENAAAPGRGHAGSNAQQGR